MRRKIRVVNVCAIAFVLMACIGVLVLYTMDMSMRSVTELQDISDRYVKEEEAVSAMREASDYLTSQSREYVVMGDKKFLDNYFNEVNVTKRRDNALELLREMEVNENIMSALESAKNTSDELMQIELRAMRLASEAYGMPSGEAERYFGSVKLSADEQKMSDEEKKERALELLFNDIYSDYKDYIHEEVFDSLENVIDENSAKRNEAYERSDRLLKIHRLLILAMLISFIVPFMVALRTLILPMSRSVRYIVANEKLPTKGSAEYSYLAETYNSMMERHKESQDVLSYEASHDGLTGLYNRKLFEEKREELSGAHTALLLVDIDHFKMFNDTYGHDVGDKVLKKVSAALASCFRNEDFPCRIGGDEFAVFMVQMNPELRHVILDKIERLKKKLEVEDGLPRITLSIGIAFSEEATSEKDLFKIADEALYRSKNDEGHDFTFYSDIAE